MDLNNIFSAETHQNLPLSGGEKLTVTRFMGIHGMETQQYYVPDNTQLAEIKFPLSNMPCKGDMNGDGDVDGSDLFEFITAYQAGNQEADLDNTEIIDTADISTFAADFGRIDCQVLNAY